MKRASFARVPVSPQLLHHRTSCSFVPNSKECCKGIESLFTSCCTQYVGTWSETVVHNSSSGSEALNFLNRGQNGGFFHEVLQGSRVVWVLSRRKYFLIWNTVTTECTSPVLQQHFTQFNSNATIVPAVSMGLQWMLASRLTAMFTKYLLYSFSSLNVPRAPA